MDFRVRRVDHPGGWTCRAGQVVSKMWPPGGSMDGQPTKVQSKMTLKPRAAAPVKRSRSLTQVWPQSQSSDVEPRNGGWAGTWGKTTANRHGNGPSPSQRDLGLYDGEPMQGGVTIRGVQVARTMVN